SSRPGERARAPTPVPARGTLPNATRAGRRLGAFTDPFAPVPRAPTCSQIQHPAAAEGSRRDRHMRAAVERPSSARIYRPRTLLPRDRLLRRARLVPVGREPEQPARVTGAERADDDVVHVLCVLDHRDADPADVEVELA